MDPHFPISTTKSIYEIQSRNICFVSRATEKTLNLAVLLSVKWDSEIDDEGNFEIFEASCGEKNYND